MVIKSRSPPKNDLDGYILVNKFINSKHFDWSVVENTISKYAQSKIAPMDVITLLRHPVDRVVGEK